MIYLDNASTTMPKPPEVVRAACEAMLSLANASRGAYDASLEALRSMMRAREAIARLFCAPGPMRVAFAPNATAALNTAISGLRGHIVTTAAEHNSVLRPALRAGECTVVPVDNLGRLDMNRLEEAIRPDTAGVVMTHASNLTGNVYDLDAAGDICRRKGVRLVVDAAQTAGLLPIDMGRSGISALCFTGHKSLYGPQGTGGICLAPDFQPEPLVVGGSGGESFSPSHPAAMPDALEAGTQNAHGIAGLLAGVEYGLGVGQRLFSDADGHARHFAREAAKTRSVTLYGDISAPVRAPIVSLNIRGVDGAQAASLLWERHAIAVRSGMHCAPRMHRAIGTGEGGAVRFSFSHTNTREDVLAALEAVAQIAGR